MPVPRRNPRRRRVAGPSERHSGEQGPLSGGLRHPRLPWRRRRPQYRLPAAGRGTRRAGPIRADGRLHPQRLGAVRRRRPLRAPEWPSRRLWRAARRPHRRQARPKRQPLCHQMALPGPLPRSRHRHPDLEPRHAGPHGAHPPRRLDAAPPQRRRGRPGDRRPGPAATAGRLRDRRVLLQRARSPT